MSTSQSSDKSTGAIPGNSKDIQSRQGGRAETSTGGASKTPHSTAGEHPAAQRLKRGLSDDEGEKGVNVVRPPEKNRRKSCGRGRLVTQETKARTSHNEDRRQRHILLLNLDDPPTPIQGKPFWTS
ncbi:hypothetical protein CF327_g2364 [Tilletia walkeri]|uniref:Uncharacterized protein n=1 Tax=Tilletia walkeri TaxID=117179 RepID=A0A8X7N4Q6_9BASI|nr:hypothetical protein CF327_g2364 [Tilletia walkeri]KAE8267061.1 hypothetical protein A4X09_0g5284 [Tilletia walkeri]